MVPSVCKHAQLWIVRDNADQPVRTHSRLHRCFPCLGGSVHIVDDILPLRFKWFQDERKGIVVSLPEKQSDT